MAAVKAGVGRETAHEVIRKHALEVALDLRAGSERNDLLDRLARDSGLGLDHLDDLVRAPLEFTGAAGAQVAEVVRQVQDVAAKHPEAAAYSPAPIL
jgi:adenylosuccinate lyase